MARNCHGRHLDRDSQTSMPATIGRTARRRRRDNGALRGHWAPRAWHCLFVNGGNCATARCCIGPVRIQCRSGGSVYLGRRHHGAAWFAAVAGGRPACCYCCRLAATITGQKFTHKVRSRRESSGHRTGAFGPSPACGDCYQVSKCRRISRSNGNITFQSCFMSTMVQPRCGASFSASINLPVIFGLAS